MVQKSTQQIRPKVLDAIESLSGEGRTEVTGYEIRKRVTELYPLGLAEKALEPEIIYLSLIQMERNGDIRCRTALIEKRGSSKPHRIFLYRKTETADPDDVA